MSLRSVGRYVRRSNWILPVFAASTAIVVGILGEPWDTAGSLIFVTIPVGLLVLLALAQGARRLWRASQRD